MDKPEAQNEFGHPFDERTGKPRKLVRTTILGIVLIVWGALSACGIIWAVVQATVFADMQKSQNAMIRATIEKQRAALQAKRDAEIAALEEQLAAAQQAGDAAGATELETRLTTAKAAPLPAVGGPLAGALRVQEMMDTPEMKQWQVIGNSVGAVTTALLIACGIGLLLRRAWGRSLAIGVAGLQIVSLFVSVFTFSWMAEHLGGWGSMTNNPAGIGMVGAMCGAMGCGLLFPVITLLVLFTRAVRAEFAAWAAVHRA